MDMQTITLAVAGAIIGAVVIGSVPAALAAPASSGMSAFKQAKRRVTRRNPTVPGGFLVKAVETPSWGAGERG